MNQQEILELIRNGESSKVGFTTEDVHPNTLAEEIVAFANFEGGVIFLGVDDAGNISGCHRSDISAKIFSFLPDDVRCVSRR